MTKPTPILVLKGPRVEDESNLEICVRYSYPEASRHHENLLFPSVIIVRTFLIIEIAGIFNRDLISLLRFIRVVPLLQYLSGDTHDWILIVMIPGRKEGVIGEDYGRRCWRRARGLEEGLES